MAEVCISVSQDQFNCPVCLDLLNDAVTVPCGHSFCKVCINKCWGKEDQKMIFSCPQCRHSFTTRPDLHKNVMIAEMMEKLKMTVPVEPVECDFCTGLKHKAVKSCLVCLASYCETHLQPHYQSPAFKKHKLVKASRKLQEQICSQHQKLLEVYCRTDQQCICMLCMLEEHKQHDAVSAEAERDEKQKELVETQTKCQEIIQEREKELQKLRKAVDSHKRSAQAAVEDVEQIFSELIQSIERKRCEVNELIRAQQKAAVSRAEELIVRLEQEISELRRRDAELEQLSQTEDHIYFLQSFRSLSAPPVISEILADTTDSLLSFESVVKYMSLLKDKVEEFCQKAFKKTSSEVKDIQIIPLPEPQSREEFLHYFCDLILDPKTANKHLRLSERNRVVTCSQQAEAYPDRPERFEYYLQVLCTESLCGRCYWEVDWSGPLGVSVAVSYKSIRRKSKSNECLFGRSEQSWRLLSSPSCHSFRHSRTETELRGSSSSRVGVYLDHRAGTLSFYSISDAMTLLHRVQTTFTQPLYAGFVVCLGSTVKMCHPAE